MKKFFFFKTNERDDNNNNVDDDVMIIRIENRLPFYIFICQTEQIQNRPNQKEE